MKSKTFRNFVADGYVLQAVSFIDIFLHFPKQYEFLSLWQCELLPWQYEVLMRQYELLSEADGLVARCSRAGNMDAQFILGKVALICASKLCNARTEAARSDFSPFQYFGPPIENYNLSDVNRAAGILDSISAQGTNRTELFYLVRNFLSRAKVLDFVDMRLQLKDFVALYLVPGKKPQHLEFFTTLDTLCKRKPFQLCVASPAGAFNSLCRRVHDLMNRMGIEEVIQPILECLHSNDDVTYETLNERWGIVQHILDIAEQVALTRGDELVLQELSHMSILIVLSREQLKQLKDDEAFVPTGRGLLLASFDALFGIQQGSP